MEYFDAYDAVIMRLTLLWLFTIVVLPFTTQLLNSRAYRPAPYRSTSACCWSPRSACSACPRGAAGTGNCCWPSPEVDDWVSDPDPG